jgi:RNA polymerase sigma factor (sigma-70 family)
MAMGGEDPAAARAAWAEFYGRHVDYLYAVCTRAYGQLLGGDAGVEDLVIETFHRAYRNARLFDADGIEDPERLRRRARAWLGRIAQRLFQDLLRSRRRIEMVHLGPEAWQQMPDKRRPVPRNDELIDKVTEALSRLSEKEQTVIRTTFQWYRPGADHQRLPHDVVTDLAETLQTTPENLRQIRKRALEKIRAFLHDSGPLCSETPPVTEKQP